MTSFSCFTPEEANVEYCEPHARLSAPIVLYFAINWFLHSVLVRTSGLVYRNPFTEFAVCNGDMVAMSQARLLLFFSTGTEGKTLASPAPKPQVWSLSSQ